MTLEEKKLNLEIMKTYTESAKSFVQLASAGLLVPTALKAALPNIRSGFLFSGKRLLPVSLSWGCLLLAIGLGALYQYVGTKSAEQAIFKDTYRPELLRNFVDNPGYIYGFMLVSFYVGAFFMLWYTWLALQY